MLDLEIPGADCRSVQRSFERSWGGPRTEEGTGLLAQPRITWCPRAGHVLYSAGSGPCSVKRNSEFAVRDGDAFKSLNIALGHVFISATSYCVRVLVQTVASRIPIGCKSTDMDLGTSHPKE